jgi:hypothetical protein
MEWNNVSATSYLAHRFPGPAGDGILGRLRLERMFGCREALGCQPSRYVSGHTIRFDPVGRTGLDGSADMSRWYRFLAPRAWHRLVRDDVHQLAADGWGTSTGRRTERRTPRGIPLRHGGPGGRRQLGRRVPADGAASDSRDGKAAWPCRRAAVRSHFRAQRRGRAPIGRRPSTTDAAGQQRRRRFGLGASARAPALTVSTWPARCAGR